VDTVNRVVPQLIARGKYVRPVLGIEVDEELNRLVIQRLATEGVAVLRVTPGLPAATAGLRGARPQPDGTIIPGDIILAVDGRTIEGVARLFSRLDDHRVGDTVRLTVLRDGRRIDVDVTLHAGSQ
jgi:S1-C subfamily serine protease